MLVGKCKEGLKLLMAERFPVGSAKKAACLKIKALTQPILDLLVPTLGEGRLFARICFHDCKKYRLRSGFFQGLPQGRVTVSGIRKITTPVPIKNRPNSGEKISENTPKRL